VDPPVLVGIDPPGVRAGHTGTWIVTGGGLAGVERFLIADASVELLTLEPAADASMRVTVRARPDALPGFYELRAVGPGGISNLLVFRVDTLPESRETEPNDSLDAANPVAFPSAVAGVLAAQDLDWYEFPGRTGERVTIDVEARRLGAPIVPVARLVGPSGRSLALSQPLRDDSGDCRLSCILPGDGRYRVCVRDALYRGGTRAPARYRLRIDDGPFATGLFPLGGRRGATFRVAACGGSLASPWVKLLTLPDEAGAIVTPGLFTGPGGSLLAPGRLVAGEGPEVDEPVVARDAPALPRPIAFGTTINGRIDRPGEIDRYLVAAPPGESVGMEFMVQAAALGSWLDSVVTVSDAEGHILAESDDRGGPGRVDLEPGAAARDSRLELDSRAAGAVVVAITDRFGNGGPEYAYRLAVGPPRGDFAVTLRVGQGASAAAPAHGAVDSGAFNLRPGSVVPVVLRVAAEGRPGPITLRASGLPPGVEAAPATVRIPPPPGRTAAPEVGVAEAALMLAVDARARPAVGWMRIVAEARRADGPALAHPVSATLVLAPVAPDDPRPPPVRVVTGFPVAVVVAPER
jgi:hypothetical protein